MLRIHRIVVLVLVFASGVSAWSTNPTPFQSSTSTAGRRKPSVVVQPLPNNEVQQPVQQREQSLTTHNMLREGGLFQYQDPRSTSGRKRTISFSHSVVRNRDGMSSWGGPVAQGLLSPSTVARLEEFTRLRQNRSPALDSFLDSYYTKGPMSCVSMLSDPDVLPHLTSAMRDIID